MNSPIVRTEVDNLASLTRFALVVMVAGIGLRVTGVPPIDLHGPLHYVGIMDPLCGGTRAMYLLTSGDLAGAARYNPAVFPLVAAIALVLARGVHGWTTGSWLSIRLSPATRQALVVVAVAALIALEIRQQLRADLLSQPWP